MAFDANSCMAQGYLFLFFMLRNIVLKSLASLTFLPNSNVVIDFNPLPRSMSARMLVIPGLETGEKMLCHVLLQNKQDISHLSMLASSLDSYHAFPKTDDFIHFLQFTVEDSRVNFYSKYQHVLSL